LYNIVCRNNKKHLARLLQTPDTRTAMATPVILWAIESFKSNQTGLKSDKRMSKHILARAVAGTCCRVHVWLLEQLQ